MWFSVVFSDVILLFRSHGFFRFFICLRIGIFLSGKIVLLCFNCRPCKQFLFIVFSDFHCLLVILNDSPESSTILLIIICKSFLITAMRTVSSAHFIGFIIMLYFLNIIHQVPYLFFKYRLKGIIECMHL